MSPRRDVVGSIGKFCNLRSLNSSHMNSRKSIALAARTIFSNGQASELDVRACAPILLNSIVTVSSLAIRHLDAFTRGRIIEKLEEGRSVTSVAAEFGIAPQHRFTTLETISNYRNSYPGVQ
ncbi:hypothetical protein TNCV_3160501 [Trichonephila clavipes]|nr:hypothetical protein TNCV_3160501 [Trichonephila clavipes]